MKHFILMADIIDSGIYNQKELMVDFKQVINEANNKFKTNLISPLTITLGDEFQGLADSLISAISIIIYIEEQFICKGKGIYLRYVLNYGLIETNINTKIAYEMLGKGLTDARKKLLELKKEKSRFYISSQNETINKILNDSFLILQNIISEWDPTKDYFLISKFLSLKDYKIIAKNLHKERSLIWKREKSLNIKSYLAIQNIIMLTSNLKLKK